MLYVYYIRKGIFLFFFLIYKAEGKGRRPKKNRIFHDIVQEGG